jgi:hypothetical protein
VVRDARVLPADAGFFLLALPVEWLSADPTFSDLHRVKEEEVGRERWERAFQETIAGLLRRFGEPGMAELYLAELRQARRRHGGVLTPATAKVETRSRLPQAGHPVRHQESADNRK